MDRRTMLGVCVGAGALATMGTAANAAPARPGRVYDVNPKDGERDGSGFRCYIAGRHIRGVYRVELDEDSDEGLALVHAYFNASYSGWTPIPTNEGNEAVKVSFRHNVYVAHKDAVDMSKAKNTKFRRYPASK